MVRGKLVRGLHLVWLHCVMFKVCLLYNIKQSIPTAGMNANTSAVRLISETLLPSHASSAIDVLKDRVKKKLVSNSFR